MLVRLGCLLMLLLPTGIAVAIRPSADPDEQLLKKLQIGTTSHELLAFFRRRTLTTDECKQVESLVRQLGNSSFTAREEASKRLREWGMPVVSYLQRALHDPDLEIVRRAESCLEEIRREEAKRGITPAVPAAVRLLGKRRPEGAIPALIGYLPFAEGDIVEEEVLNALVSLGTRPGKVDPAFVQALSDSQPSRRAGAAYVFGRLSDANQRQSALRLLVDPDSRVRLRAAQGLVFGKEKAAVPVLISLLTEPAAEISAQAEELLLFLAGEQAPNLLSGDISPQGKQQYRTGWASWWREHESKIDLARLEEKPPYLGLTLIAQMDSKKVWECGRDGLPRWTLNNLQGPLDAQVLPGGRVLVAEFQGGRVTERDLKGNILWEKNVPNPVVCERLPNGNTFIASYSAVMEVARDGKVLYSHQPMTGGNIYAAQRMRNGHILCVTLEGSLIELEAATGKVLRTIRMETNNSYSVEGLAGGRFLVTSYTQGKVLEIDATGKVVWEAVVPSAYHATRLPNGNTLVSSHGTKRVVELGRDGKIVWEKTLDSQVWRVHRR